MHGDSIFPWLLTASFCIKDYSLHFSDEDTEASQS